jgi:transcriptional regulator with GAF, ATPase, and Fis domain
MIEAAIIGRSVQHCQLLEKLSKVASTDAEILFTGPSGVGKELYARYVHKCGPRQKSPFVAVNCGALPSELLENELFGHVGGAFTGARLQSEGLVAAAEGGMLFLDEVDSLPLISQVKLLRFLQEKEYRRLGETSIRRADIRVLAATNTDLVAAVREGKFRQDLFFRIRVIPVEVPPLNERPEDIAVLLEEFPKDSRTHINCLGSFSVGRRWRDCNRTHGRGISESSRTASTISPRGSSGGRYSSPICRS